MDDRRARPGRGRGRRPGRRPGQERRILGPGYRMVAQEEEGEGPVRERDPHGQGDGGRRSFRERMRRNRRLRPPRLERRAHGRLRRFRQASILAVAVTGLLLTVWSTPQETAGQVPDTAVFTPQDTMSPDTAPRPEESFEEATGTVRDLLVGFYGLLPKILIALGIILAALLLTRLVGPLLRRLLRNWEKAQALSALTGVLIWILALGIALSVIAGDARALIGSVGLVGLALSWALQTPIESFTGWLLNSFKGYYTIGDRIGVGDVFGDVYRIDVLTTTVWEAGGPDKPVQAAQSTGALITFPNSEVLRSNVVNYTRDFPFVWDEVTVSVTNESDLAYTLEVVEEATRRVLGDTMAESVRHYRVLLEGAGLAFDIAEAPTAYLALAESWTDVTVRYLIPARQRRRWSSTILLALSQEFARPEHRDRILPAYPRTQVDLLDRRARD